MSITDKTITLADGRTLAYTEHGDLSGTPIIFFHGNPGSRLMRHPDESLTESLGVRIITPDRPGYGLSSYQENRELLMMPDDIQQLVDALEIETFYVMGVSAGGPYTAATAYALPDRVQAAAIVSGAAPFDRENPYEGVNDTYTTAYKMAAWPSWVLKPMLWMQTKSAINDPEKAMQQSLTYLSDADGDLLAQPEFREQVKGYRPEATRNGVDGIVREAKILVSSWGFDLSAIKVPVHLWYWQDDTLVPQPMGRYLEKHIPQTIGHFLDGGGHFSIFTHWQAIIQSLITTEHD